VVRRVVANDERHAAMGTGKKVAGRPANYRLGQFKRAANAQVVKTKPPSAIPPDLR
jgi:hypothetical protein